MHCPQCGQEQTSAEMRFCKSCGFCLDAVKQLLAADGTTQAFDTQSPDAAQSPRKKGIRHGVILLFISMILVPLGVIIGPPEGPAFPVIFIMAGLMRILYAVIFQEKAPRKQGVDPRTALGSAAVPSDELGSRTAGHALPSSRSVPADAFAAPRSDTAKMARPPSVTEHTTKLLDEPDP